MITKKDIVYCNVSEIINKDKKLDIQINNIDLKKININKALLILQKYNLINNGYIIIKKNSKISIKLYKNMHHYIFKNQNIIANLYFYKNEIIF